MKRTLLFALLFVAIFCSGCGQKGLEVQKLEHEKGSIVIDLPENEKLVSFGLNDDGKGFVVHKKRQDVEQPEEYTVERLAGIEKMIKNYYIIREH